MTHKEQFISACNILDGDEFVSASCDYLKSLEDKDNLNDFITIVGGIFKNKYINSGDLLTDFCLLFREKICVILLDKADVPDYNIIKMYYYFSLCNLPIDAKIASYEIFVDKNLYTDGVSDMDRIYLLVLRFFASFANSREYSFERFLSSLSLVDFMQAEHISLSPIMIDFINHCRESVESILAIMAKNWNKEFYFSLSKLQRRSTFTWDLHCIGNVERCFAHPVWTSFYSDWKEILYEHFRRDECDEAMYVQFYIYHRMGNSFQTKDEWKTFNEEISVKAAEYYKDWGVRSQVAQPKSSINIKEGSKIIIGFLQDRLVDNAPYKVQFPVWRSLVNSEEFRNRYEIRVYLMSYFEKSNNDEYCVKAVESLGIKVWDGAIPFYLDSFYHNHLSKALHVRDRIISDGVGILISPNNGYDISDFLIVNRSAPKQIFWSHGNFEYDIDGIDKKMTHISIGSENGFDVFSHSSVKLLNDIEKAFLLQEAEKIRHRIGKDKVILGTIGRLIKIDNEEFLDTLEKILKSCKNTVYLACGGGNVASIMEKIKARGIEDRVYFEGFVDTKIYSFVLDIFLDTFPLLQGESAKEVNIWGCIPRITMWVEGAHGSLWIKGLDGYFNQEVEEAKLKSNFIELSQKVRSGYELGDEEMHTLVEFYENRRFTINDYVESIQFLIDYPELLEKIKHHIRKALESNSEGCENNEANEFLHIMDNVCH